MPPRQREVFIQMTADEQKAVESFLRVDRSLRGVEKSFESGSQKGKRYDTSLQSISRTASGLLGFLGVGGGVAGLVSVLGQGMEAAAEKNAQFTNEMRELLSLGDNLSNIRGVKDEVISLSNEWGIATQEVSSGMFQIQSGAANMSKAVQDDLFRTGAAMTEVFGGQLDQNINTLLKTMQIYGDEVGTASEAQAKLATIAEEGYLNLQELSQLLPDVIGPAAALGRNLDEVGASLIVATRLGGKNEKTFTGLRNVFQGMSTAIEKGLTTHKAFIDQLRDLEKIDPDTLTKVFGKEAAPTLLNLVNNIDQVSEALGSMQANASSAFDKLEQRANDAGAALEKTLRQIQQASENLNKSDDFAGSKAADALSGFQARKLAAKAGLSSIPEIGPILAETPYLGSAITGFSAGVNTLADPILGAIAPGVRGVNKFFSSFGGDPRFESAPGGNYGYMSARDTGLALATVGNEQSNPTRARRSYERYLNENATVSLPPQVTVIQGGNYASTTELAQRRNGQRAGQAGRL